ncbi:hypothetical protein IMSHALPRED_006433 [Imshaugia aleurites]|uniref:Uncharacterized protein n=1 Tax=Imshaugia aleurites TaxID=172621 RepID=A0A8H3ILH0_9LECA|nr:hypothetical protein IMSHALPRED_006433 [Imshaugia aleurites]
MDSAASRHHSPVFDLSGANPFDVVFEVDRFRGDGAGWRSITLLLNGSLLDVFHAFTHGLLELIDLDADRKIVFNPENDGVARPTVSNQLKFSASFEVEDLKEDIFSPFSPEEDNVTISAPSAQPERRFLTLPTRASGGKRKAQKIISLCVSATIQHLLKSGRRCRLQTTSVDLLVKWWQYGSQEELAVKDVPVELLPPPEPATIVATRICHRDFSVVESLPVPPSIHISLGLSPPVIYRSGDPTPILEISITNTANQPVTMISFGSQPYISSHHAQSNNHARIISTSAEISLENF